MRRHALVTRASYTACMTQDLLSRREVLTRTIQVSALATVFLTGCGGFLGGGGSSSQSVTGSITVPPGVVDADLVTSYRRRGVPNRLQRRAILPGGSGVGVDTHPDKPESVPNRGRTSGSSQQVRRT